MTDRSTPTAAPACPPDGRTPARGSGARFELACGPQEAGQPAALAAVLRAAMAAHRGHADGDVWDCLASAVQAYMASSGQWVERAVYDDQVRCLEVDVRRAEEAFAALMAHRDQLAAAVVRLLGMADAWERRLPDTIRTDAAEAVRAVFDGIPLPRTPEETP